MVASAEMVEILINFGIFLAISLAAIGSIIAIIVTNKNKK